MPLLLVCLTYLAIDLWLTGRSSVPMIFGLQLACLAIGIAWSWRELVPRLRFCPRDAAVVAISAFVTGVAVTWFLKRAGVDDRDLYGDGWEWVVYLVFFAPLIEEVFFRFFLWVPLERFGPWVVVPLTAVLFSLLHLRYYFDVSESLRPVLLVQGAVTLAFGIVVGLIQCRTRSLTLCFFAHVAANSGAVLVGRWG